MEDADARSRARWQQQLLVLRSDSEFITRAGQGRHPGDGNLWVGEAWPYKQMEEIHIHPMAAAWEERKEDETGTTPGIWGDELVLNTPGRGTNLSRQGRGRHSCAIGRPTRTLRLEIG